MKKSQSSDYFNRLEKFLAIDEEGNITAGKNLEADGTIRAINGFKPVATYQFTATVDGEQVNYSLADYGQYQDQLEHILGVRDADGNYSIIGFGIFLIQNQKLEYVYLIGYSGLDGDSEILSFSSNNNNILEISSVAPLNIVQPQIYIHTLTLTADSKSYTLLYQSTNNLKVGSIADLRTITNVKATSDNIILPVCLTDLSGTAALQITTTLCKVGAANVNTVSDKVTTL